MIEFTDITLKSTLPLNQYLFDNPRLSLRLILNGAPCNETSVVDGDRETGRWVFNSRFYVPQESDSFKLAAIVNIGVLKVQLLSIAHRVADLVAHLKGNPAGYRKINICGPNDPIKFNIVCKLRLSSPLTGLSILGIDEEKHAPKDHKRDTESRLGERRSTFPSREDLEARHLETAKLRDLDKKARLLSLLGRSYYALYRQTSQMADLEKALSMHEEAIQLTPLSHPELSEHLEHAGDALVARFNRTGDPAAITKAISHYKMAVRVTDDTNPAMARHLSDLGAAFCQLFERLREVVDIDSAIETQQKAVDITPNDHPGKPGRLNNLGISLLRRFERLGNLADIESAIGLQQQAVEMTPNGHLETPALLNNLGNSLQGRFDRLGNLADIDNAIGVQQQAVQTTPDGHPDKPNRLSNLGSSLSCRFQHLGNLTDIDNAIGVHQQAVETTPDGHPDKSALLNNLGTSLSRRFERLGNLTDLDSAIGFQQKAVEIIPVGHPDKPSRLNDLGNSLLCRFERLGNLVDIDRAIRVQQQAVETTPNAHPEKPSLLSNLGSSLSCRFLRLGNLNDIDSAIVFHQKVVEITPDGHPDKPGQLNNLGNSFRRRFERLRDCKDMENALESYSRAAYSVAGPAKPRFMAACAWATVAHTNARTPLPAWKCAIDLLPRIAWVGLAPADQHALLAEIGEVVRYAVAAAIEFEEYETAVEWAEQGRSIVWQNLLGLRSPMDDLNAVNPELSNRLQSIARQLESPVSQGVVPGTKHTRPVEDTVRSYSQLGTDWDNTVEEIRQTPGFDGFLKAKSFAKLAATACEGPVVVLNVQKDRSDALVLIPDESSALHCSIICIPLESSTHAMSTLLLTSMIRLLSSAGVRSRSIPMHKLTQSSVFEEPPLVKTYERLFEHLKGCLSPSDVRASERVTGHPVHAKLDCYTILGFLWLAVVKPVLEGLAFSAEPAKPPRIWWSATGPLAFLPLHAAGIYGSGGVGNILSDYVVSSYTPTLTAILDQSQPVVQPDFQMLTVAVAAPEHATRIPGTEAEVAAIQNLAQANGVSCVPLTKESATVKQVSEGMQDSNWIHLACHGQQNFANAMQSGFLLQDGTLELSAIIRLSLPKADFAFLSACQTATGDEKVAEESVHLAAGMLMLGCRGVIATMWSISDNDAPQVAEDVYRHILKGGKPNRKEAAYALHEAVKRLRESGAGFLSWVPFIHIGR